MGKPYGLFTAGKWLALAAEARKRPELLDAIRVQYPRDGLSEAQVVEEAVVEMYRAWASRREPQGPLARTWERIRAFLRAVAIGAARQRLRG